ncbi:GrpE nucleotide exchange factor, partial [Fragilariopsis cylindrus CCMP1102]
EQEVQKLKMELVDLKNQLLRSLAEQENIRNIARNDVKAAKDFSTKSFAKSMLEVADNLDRALESVVTSPETTSSTSNDTNNDTLKSFVEGIELTNSGLLKALQSNGVEAYCEQPGDEFNPDKHQALMEYIDPDPTKSAGTIGVVMKKGYTLNKRVLRPAEVGVIK